MSYEVVVQYPAHSKFFECSDYGFSNEGMMLTLVEPGEAETYIYVPSTEAITIQKRGKVSLQ